MNAQDRRLFSEVCESLAKSINRLAQTEEYAMPFHPLEVAEKLSTAAKELRPGPRLCDPKRERPADK